MLRVLPPISNLSCSNLGGKTGNIASQPVLQQYCKTGWTLISLSYIAPKNEKNNNKIAKILIV